MAKRFSTFEGVFTPCLLSILGVIMYLRLGWVVGSIGFGGTLIIICFANMITLSTALSMSSVVTNIRIGPGGAYSIITKSLGLEAGGAIGFPLYLSQAISVAFYITGFAECWLFVFPSHSLLLVSLIAWALLLIISYLSAKFAFKVQYFIFVLIGLSIVSIMMGKGSNVSHQFSFWGGYQTGEFWTIFAVFFPAVTGILAGASMSGELNDPKKSIPIGTLAAIGVSFAVYVLLSYWYAKQIPLAELRVNTSIAVEMGRWRWMVVAGIMGATISSALAMFVGSPRVLLAMGKHAILPFMETFARINKRGEPSTAILFTALLSLITILFGSLNQIASLLTMFFLITYGMINLTVFIEQSIGIPSFRPTFKVPKIIPFWGTVSCVAVMFLIDAKFSFIAFIVILVMYVLLIKTDSQAYSPEVRSGLLVFVAEQFAKAASKLPYYPKIWKPNLLVPVEDMQKLDLVLPFLKNIILPTGRLTIFKVVDRKNSEELYTLKNVEAQSGEDAPIDPKERLNQELSLKVKGLRDENIFVETAVVQAPEVLEGAVTVMQTVGGLFFPPNTMFYVLNENNDQDHVAGGLVEKASDEGLSNIVLRYDKNAGFGLEKDVNLWVRSQSPNINLSILIALQLKRNWDGVLRIVQVVYNEQDRQEALNYLLKLKKVMRLPLDVEIEILVGNFMDLLKQAPKADINIFGMQEKPDIALIRNVSAAIGTSVLFLRDSDNESALA